MDHVPTGSILMLVVVDLGLVLLMSMAYGAVVARSDVRPASLGAVVGLVLPLVGPLVWALVAAGRSRQLARVGRARFRPTAAWLAAGLAMVSAGLFVVATPLPWGAVSGSFESYALATDSAPADTGIGLVATVLSAVLMVAVALATVLTTSRVRVSMVAGLVAGLWLLVTLDGLIVFGALADLSAAADGLSSGRASLEAAPAAALWLCMVAGTLALMAGVLLLVPVAAATEAPAIVPVVRPTDGAGTDESQCPVATATARSTWGVELPSGDTTVRADDGWAVDDGWR